MKNIDQIFELRKGAKHPQCNSNFMNKIGGRSNTEFSNLAKWKTRETKNLQLMELVIKSKYIR